MMSIRIILAYWLLFALSYNVCLAETKITAETGFHLDWWDSPNNDTGLQYYIPIKVDALYNDLTIGLITGYAYSTHRVPHQRRRSVYDLLDTKVNLGYTVAGLLPVDVLFGLDFNLPTGRTDLKDKDLVVIMDPDLVSITSLGEGFNVNPTISIAKDWGRWLLGMGFGYLIRGEYDYTHTLRNYDPGDAFTFTTQIHYFPSEAWEIKFISNFTTYGTDELDDSPFYKEGDYLQIGIGAKYTQRTYDLEAVIQAIIRDKSKFFDQIQNRLHREEDNSHGNEWIGTLTGHYRMDDKTILNSSVGLLLITENSYNDSSPYYWGERRKVSFNLGVKRAIGHGLTGELNVGGFFMHDGATWYHPNSAQSYRGFSIEFKLSSNF